MILGIFNRKTRKIDPAKREGPYSIDKLNSMKLSDDARIWCNGCVGVPVQNPKVRFGGTVEYKTFKKRLKGGEKIIGNLYVWKQYENDSRKGTRGPLNLFSKRTELILVIIAAFLGLLVQTLSIPTVGIQLITAIYNLKSAKATPVSGTPLTSDNRFWQIIPADGDSSVKLGVGVLAESQTGDTNSFPISILQENYWRIKSFDNLESGSLEDVLNTYLSQLNDKYFKDASTIIAVGTASQEGNKISQEALAFKRANAILKIINEHSLGERQTYLLNLGQYINSNLDKEYYDTSLQRRVIIIGVNEQLGTNTDTIISRLKRALNRPESVLKIDKYSKYQELKLETTKLK